MSDLEIEEVIELIDYHGKMLTASICPKCHGPMKEYMLERLERMRELILTLPDHVEEIVFEPELGTMQ